MEKTVCARDVKALVGNGSDACLRFSHPAIICYRAHVVNQGCHCFCFSPVICIADIQAQHIRRVRARCLMYTGSCLAAVFESGGGAQCLPRSRSPIGAKFPQQVERLANFGHVIVGQQEFATRYECSLAPWCCGSCVRPFEPGSAESSTRAYDNCRRRITRRTGSLI